ncbi:MAG: hypothetical protein QOG96_7036 [Pseudonocardiales bacterium]|jgi:hypothetical protein|nr:hypothetical protein [Pseudonocardiales bacterium]
MVAFHPAHRTARLTRARQRPGRCDGGRAAQGRPGALVRRRGGPTVHKIGRLPISWDRDGATAVARAHEQFRWFAGGWKVNAELPGTAAFAFRQPVRPTRGRGRVDRVRTRRPRAHRGVSTLRRTGFQARRGGAGGWGHPAGIPGVRRARADPGAARGIRQGRGTGDPEALMAGGPRMGRCGARGRALVPKRSYLLGRRWALPGHRR